LSARGSEGEEAGARRKKKKILFLSRGDSLYDEMFLRSFLTEFEVACATFNPKPTVNLSNSTKLILMSNALMFLYNYTRARYLIYSLGHRQIKNVIEREKPDLMVCSYSTTYGFMGARSGFHPFVLITFGSDLLLAPKSPLLAGRTRLALSKADLVLVDGATAERAAVKLGADEKRILKFTRFDPDLVLKVGKAEGSSSLRSKLGIEDKDKKVVLHTRWFESLYNVETVVRGFALASKKVPDLVLVLVGSGSLEARIRRLVKGLGIGDRVYFTGRVPRQELISMCDEADVYVSASLSDSMHGSLMEAICRGTPAIVSDSETNREWIQDGVSGLLFNPSSPRELADKIITVLQDPGKFKEMALSAKSDLMRRSHWHEGEQSMIQKLLELSESTEER